MEKVTMTEKLIYPWDWSFIATEAKRKAGYKCQNCSRAPDSPGNPVITVHHKDHNPLNNDETNLIVLCARCHLQIEGNYRKTLHYSQKLKALYDAGQQILPGFTTLLTSQDQLNITPLVVSPLREPGYQLTAETAARRKRTLLP